MDDNIHLVFTINVHDEDGGLWGEVAELPGCFASGADLDELRAAFDEAIPLYLDELTQEELSQLPTDRPNVIHADFTRNHNRPPARVSKMDMLIEA